MNDLNDYEKTFLNKSTGNEPVIADLEERLAKLLEQVYAHGVLRCARCKLRLIKSVINMQVGEIYADDRPGSCPNGCGPLWRVTWKEEAQENLDLVESQRERIAQLVAEKKEFIVQRDFDWDRFKTRIAELEAAAGTG